MAGSRSPPRELSRNWDRNGTRTQWAGWKRAPTGLGRAADAGSHGNGSCRQGKETVGLGSAWGRARRQTRQGSWHSLYHSKWELFIFKERKKSKLYSYMKLYSLYFNYKCNKAQLPFRFKHLLGLGSSQVTGVRSAVGRVSRGPASW